MKRIYLTLKNIFDVKFPWDTATAFLKCFNELFFKKKWFQLFFARLFRILKEPFPF